MGLNIATPLYRDGTIFASSAYGAGGGLGKLTKEADGSIPAHEVYFPNDHAESPQRELLSTAPM